MADSSSYWSDWASNIVSSTKQAPAPTKAPAEDTDIETYNNRNLPMWQRVGLQAPPSEEPQNRPPIAGPNPASQQPTIPIQTAQGAPQSPTQQVGTAPNSGVVGASPFANQALTAGSGMPIGGLPTQSPTQDYNSPQQVNPIQMQQSQLQQLRMANAPRIQQFQQLMARLRQQVPTLGLS